MLGKKSWNVYNPENVARVRRDEAEARAREAEDERHLRDNEAEDRLDRLRGTKEDIEDGSEGPRKRRKLAGEDDTDRDLQLARQSRPDAATSQPDLPLFDGTGHIDLVQEKPQPSERSSRKPKGGQDEVGVPLADATGRKSGSGKTWYSSTSADGGYAHETVSRDVWGNEDPRRLQREKQRMDLNDPLAAMKKGVNQLRDAETRRQEWMQQRERDLNEVEDLARKECKRRKRQRSNEDQSLDDFSLDEGYRRHREREDSHRSRHHHHHHHRSRPRDRPRSPRKD